MISYLITSSLLVIPAWVVYRFLVRGKASLRQQKGFLARGCAGEFVVSSPNAKHRDFWLTTQSKGESGRIWPDYRPSFAPAVLPLRESQLRPPHHIPRKRLVQCHVGTQDLVELCDLSGHGRCVSDLLGADDVPAIPGRPLPQRVHSNRWHPLCAAAYPRPHSVGTFWLGKSYLIWQEQLGTLTEQELHAVYRHELSHIQQGNTFEKAALRLIQCLWCWHPVFYLVRKELTLLSEFLADEAGASVLPKPQAYAHLLLNLQVLKSLPLAQHFQQSQLRKRIERLLQPPATTSSLPGSLDSERF